MIRVAFIARSTLYSVYGGITVQVLETAKNLRTFGVDVTVHLADEKIDYTRFDLLHFFDVIRPANILYHIKKSKKPFVISPVFLDYSEYDKTIRKGISGFIFRLFSADTNEYIKAVLRWLLGKDKLPSKSYLWKGQRNSVRYILQKAEMILPNSQKEYEQLIKQYKINKHYTVIPNGIDTNIFHSAPTERKNNRLVVCAAMIEGRKNQHTLIKALNNTDYKLILIGKPAPNQKKYFEYCQQIASSNIEFAGEHTQEQLSEYYKKAKVHILPSWFETCGLSSLEAAAMGCNVIITDKGYAREYFGDDALYCDPSNTESIYSAVKEAASKPVSSTLQERILNNYTWQKAAQQTLEAYKKIFPENTDQLSFLQSSKQLVNDQLLIS